MENTVIEQPVVEQPVTEVAEVVETIVAPAPEELSYSYQPTDENGRPIGGKQVLKYTTQDELIEKLREQSINQIRQLRKVTRNARLGIQDEDDAVPENAPRIEEEFEFNPRTLSDDERVMLSRNLLDPDKFKEAADTLFEATLGANPERLRATLTSLQRKAESEKAQREVASFMSANPDYVVCAENSTAITNWMTRKNLSPVQENFQTAYNTLRKAGIMIERLVEEPVVEQVTPPVVEPVAEPVVTPPVQTPAQRGAPSGFSRTNSSNAGPVAKPGADITYELIVNGQKRLLTGAQALDAMPSEEYKKRIKSDPTFAKKVDKLYSKV